MTSSQPGIGQQRGAIIIHVAFALLALIAFTAMVVDYGVMWVSRRQAQNAADAGALAGAVSLMNDGGVEAVAQLSAQQFTNNARIWGELNSASNVRIDFSGPSKSIWPCGSEYGCVRVDVFRNVVDRADRSTAVLGTPIPTYFGILANRLDQGVRATATARVAPGGAIECLLPFAVMDRWADNYDDKVDTTYWSNDGLPGTAGWTNNDDYQPTASPVNDTYIPPYDGNTNHTGWKVLADFGRQLILKFGTSTYSSGWSNRVYLPGSGGANDYENDIKFCNRTPVGIATAEEPCAPAPGGDTTGREINGCISVGTGVAQGPTVQGIDYIVNNIVGGDPGATWNSSYTWPDGRVGAVFVNGVVDMDSKRIRPLAVVDIQHYQASGCTGGTCIAKIANIIGFFVEGMCADVKKAGKLVPGNDCEDPNKDVVGRIVKLPGLFVAGTGTVVSDASFIEVVRLVR